MTEKEHKAGFVNILGNPNVGKSTLMNEMVGERISIITSKAQTTRHRVMGIVNGDDFQIVYSDTPGMLQPNYKLQEAMVKSISTAMIDADMVLFMTDMVEKTDKNLPFIDKLNSLEVPVMALINKIDLSNQEDLEAKIDELKALLPKADIIPVSALHKFNLQAVFDRIINHLPVSPPYYPKDELTDRPQRFFVAEMIREKIFLHYKKEIPYSTEVAIEYYEETKNIDRIRAIIYVGRDSHKKILIGTKGQALKKIGTEARKDIEEFIQKKVFIELFVKVSKEWKNNSSRLKEFGY
ncbi:MAG: GTPase Era [Bacteroidota bacterium]